MPISIESDPSLAQGYIKVNGTTAATVGASGLTADVTGNVTGNVVGNLTGSLTAGGSLTFGTVRVASGKHQDFMNIPSWAKRVTMVFSGISTDDTSIPIIQLGTSAGLQTSGYSGSAGFIVTTTVNSALFSAGFGLNQAHSAASVYHGHAIITNITGNVWVSSLVGAYSNSSGLLFGAGSVSLSGVLTRVRLTTAAGTGDYDAGTINVLYEG
jgi:hypothetical protein